MTSLLLYLSSHTKTRPHWAMLDSHGKTETQGYIDDNTNFTLLPKDCHVIAIIPGEDILLTSAQLPKLSRQRIRQALPFALEDKLIDHVEQNHYAVGEQQKDGAVPVAVIATQKMEDYVGQLTNAGLHSYQMIPAMLTLPFEPEQYYCGLLDDICLVRTGIYAGFACDHENNQTFLTVEKPEQLNIVRFSEKISPFTIKGVNYSSIPLSEKSFLECAYQSLKRYPSIDLAQGNFQTKRKKSFTKKCWRWSAGLAAGWIALLMLSNIISFFILHSAVQKNELAIQRIYKQHFPSSTSVVAPRERMQDKLKKLSSAAHQNAMLYSLGFIGNSLQQHRTIHLDKMNFHDTIWQLSVTSDSFDKLDNFMQSLTKQGLSAKTQGAGISDGNIKANIIIKAGAV